ncbi:flagellar biosynthesis protein FlhF [Leptospira ilyithenensis]|uniref:Flagellar biosynthesis protein FlhF n=1 Tax=Leptospira ilyithenensis TaxID=2484901 RepID=A0A4R9LU62_9LEPT|nr:flagellar biosynthesis protein FlhF [Leptospira ilyithenensis]TGN13785.1 flagellar biosynthesis protein FlhF [Leptospira ilyithenensis]
MDFVKIRGKDLQDCIMQMKMKYGPEAHIYDQRVTTEGGLFGTGLLASKMYEIDVGIPEKQNSKDRIEKKLKDLKELIKQKQKTDSLVPANEKKVAKTIEAVRPYSERRRRAAVMERMEPIVIDDDDYELESSLKPYHAEEQIGLSLANVSEIHEKPSISREIPQVSVPKRHSNIEKLSERLKSEGMSASYAEEITQVLEEHLSSVDASRFATVCEKAISILESRITIDSDLFSGTPRGKRKVVFFVGPTGAGKTTSIAKLAAKYSLHMGKKVSLYTTDNYRIAAIDQLKFYADAMGMPFYAAKDVRKLKEAVARDGSELILVDTAGYSHKNPDNILKLREFYQAFGDKDYLENILVLSSTISSANARSVADAYETIGYKRILLTKLDEAEYLGSVVELADTIHREFAFCSVGQDVPFDILNASKKLLAECVVYPEKLKGIAGEVFDKTT